jgi:hypothetical protein
MHVAARHLDLINQKLALTDCTVEKAYEENIMYVNKKIKEIEAAISDVCQELMSFKCDLLEEISNS